MCWIAIGFLLIICVLTLGRSAAEVITTTGTGQSSAGKAGNQGNILEELSQNEKVVLEGVITSKEYKESIYGGYWQIVLKQVCIQRQNDSALEKDFVWEKDTAREEDSMWEEDTAWGKYVPWEKGKVARLEGKYLCQITKYGHEDLKIGQRILLEATYTPWESPSNEGQFDSAKYYISQGILGQFRKGKISRVGADYNILQEKMWLLRQNMQEILQQQLGEREGGLIGAMLLGEKSDLNQEDKSLYQRNGISHILAISGLHLSLLGMGIYKVLLKILPGKKMAAVLCMLIMSLYCIFTGNSISTNRATVMFVLSLLAVILDRSYDSLSALGLTAILQLFTNPYVLNNSGFLLSFLAVIGVTFLAPILQQLFSCRKKWEKSLCVSVSATLTTLPVILTSYGTYPWYSVFLNLLVLPAMSLLLLCAILLLVIFGIYSLCCGNGILELQNILLSGNMLLYIQESDMKEGWVNVLVSLFLGLLKIIIRVVLKYFELCCEGFEKFIYQDGYVGAPGWVAICIYGGLLLIAASGRIVNSLFFRKMILLSALCFLTMRFHTGLEVTMLDVGQGDCVVIRNSNGNVYISDCGSSSVSKVGKYRLLPFLKNKGYGRIKGIFISHMDEDHMNGIWELLEMAPTEHLWIEYVFLPESVLYIKEDEETLEELCDLALKNGTKIVYLSHGEEIRDDDLYFSCLYSGVEEYGISLEETNNVMAEGNQVAVYGRNLDRNNSSLVMLMEYREFEMLFTGDVEEEGERDIVSYMEEAEKQKMHVMGEDRRIDVLKVAHHGSSGSSCEEFLEAFQPKLSLVSCGKNNSYGHPHRETIERLENCETTILTTPDSGAITLKIRNKKMRIWEYKK